MTTDSQSNRLGAYLAPRWSSDPVPDDVLDLRFEVIRDGVALGPEHNIALHKGAFTIVGRQPDICHATLLHPSISRQHAVVQHGPQGAVFIYDMGSTHGTKLNKAQLPAGQFVPLRVGDVVQFGLSTRLYCVEGPERLRPPEWQSLHGPLAPKPLVPAPPPLPQESSRSDSDSDAVDDDDDDDDIEDLDQYLMQGTLQFSTLSQKQQRFVADLNKKRSRLAHILKETETLQTKESINGSLTAGQQKQLTRCMEQMTNLQAEVDQQTEDLIQRLKEKRRSKRRQDRPDDAKSAVKRQRYVDSDEDDEFYNRTNVKKTVADKKLTNNKRSTIETYDSLKLKLKSLQEREAEIVSQIALLQKKDADASISGEDSLEQFMNGISRVDVAQQLENINSQRAELEAERIQVEKLIKIVTPAGSHLLAARDSLNS